MSPRLIPTKPVGHDPPPASAGRRAPSPPRALAAPGRGGPGTGLGSPNQNVNDACARPLFCNPAEPPQRQASPARPRADGLLSPPRGCRRPAHVRPPFSPRLSLSPGRAAARLAPPTCAPRPPQSPGPGARAARARGGVASFSRLGCLPSVPSTAPCRCPIGRRRAALPISQQCTSPRWQRNAWVSCSRRARPAAAARLATGRPPGAPAAWGRGGLPPPRFDAALPPRPHVAGSLLLAPCLPAPFKP